MTSMTKKGKRTNPMKTKMMYLRNGITFVLMDWDSYRVFVVLITTGFRVMGF
jgi:hypothetical protein